MKKLSIAYFGSPDFSADVLESLVTDRMFSGQIVKVFTQKDSPVGRTMQITKTPVKAVAQKHQIPIIDQNPKPEDLKDIDLVLLFAYGQIIPQNLLGVPRYGFWNIHPSLLPAFRGPSPVAEVLIRGLAETGVTLMKMDAKLDHGPIIAQEKLQIREDERRDELTTRLSREGLRLFTQMVGVFVSQNYVIRMQEQVESNATYTKLLQKEDGFIAVDDLKKSLSANSDELYNKFRGLFPWPGVWTEVRVGDRDLRLKITDMKRVDGIVVIKKVQLEGKNEVDFTQFNSAYQIF